MEDKIKAILEHFGKDLESIELDYKEVESKIRFYKQHKLNEELRIAKIKQSSICYCMVRWRRMHTEISEAITKQ